ncbi:MAG: substrate-binding domain-containing protein, partial [Pseudomonadota bacterium]
SPERVRAATRAKVEDTIAELGFVRSAAARAINSGRTRILGALIPTIEHDIFGLTIDTIEDRLADLGLSLVVATTDDDPIKEERKAKELLDIGVEGLFLSGMQHSDTLYGLIDHTKVPAVAISCFDPAYHFPTIGYDNHEAGRMALQHLTDQGHRKIAVVHGPTDHNDRTRGRLTALDPSLEDLNLTFWETELSVAGGCVAAANSMTSAPDAYLCLSDVQAFGVLFELQRLRIEVPRDVSVIGIQDLPSSASTVPRLTTVRLPAQRMGRKAAELLAAWVENDVKPEPVCFPSSLVVRQSTMVRKRPKP